MASPAPTTRLFSAKQFVFACILATVVSVVAFAVGVVVGRDSPYRSQDPASNPATASPDASPASPRLVIVGEPEGEPTADALDEVTYPDRLGADGPHAETLRGLPLYTAGVTSRSPTPPPTPIPTPEAATVPIPAELAGPVGGTNTAEPAAGPVDAAAANPAAAPVPPPGSDPYTVQVAALRAADAAQAFAGRLIAKGFPAYVVEPAAEGPIALYRVRVGRYADHGEAERIRQRLQQEEQLTPWITR